eukprot:Opistho-2@37151
MVAAYLYLAAAAVVLVAIVLLGLVGKNAQKTKDQEQMVAALLGDEDDEDDAVATGGARRPRTARNRLRAAAQRRAEEVESPEVRRAPAADAPLMGSDVEDDDDAVDANGKKIGAKKAAKLAAKEDKKAQRELMEAQREDKKRRDALLDEERKKKEAEEKAVKDAEAETERKRLEEIARQEEEEYQKLKASFTVEDAGSGESEIMAESQSLLQDFVDYVKNKKVVLLEDLAAHFKLRTQDAINRLRALEDMGRITGVTDDRGKFIHVSMEELEAVAKYIRQNGRVAISDIADASNRLINLAGSTSVEAPSLVQQS